MDSRKSYKSNINVMQPKILKGELTVYKWLRKIWKIKNISEVYVVNAAIRVHFNNTKCGYCGIHFKFQKRHIQWGVDKHEFHHIVSTKRKRLPSSALDLRQNTETNVLVCFLLIFYVDCEH